jgi:hypothetical protein
MGTAPAMADAPEGADLQGFVGTGHVQVSGTGTVAIYDTRVRSAAARAAMLSTV